MIHLAINEPNRIRHEYWEREQYERQPNATGRRPYYVMYEYKGEEDVMFSIMKASVAQLILRRAMKKQAKIVEQASCLNMREETPEEQEAVKRYLKKISKPTGDNFWDLVAESEAKE